MRLLVLIAILTLASTAAAQDRTQILFKEPSGMKVFWLIKENGKPVYSTKPLEVPGRFNFLQGAVYQLKLTRIEGHAGLELFPTLEVVTANPQTRAFLMHNSVPIQLTADEISQVVKGGFFTKVVYLPSQQNGDAITTATGQDAIREATRRGNVLVVLRIGNIVEPPTPKK